MRAIERLVSGVLAAFAIGGSLLAQNLDRRRQARIEETLRHEGEAVIALADEAADGHAVPADFALDWHNDFFTARPGTFIPFIVRIGAPQVKTGPALLYVRAARRAAAEPAAKGRPRRAGSEVVFHPFEEIYPIDLGAEKGQPVRIARGFSLRPGDYDLTVVVREREREGGRKARRLAAVLRRPLSVPDFDTGELTTSSVILADRLTVLAEPLAPDRVYDRPYVIGNREIRPAPERDFARQEELIVVFLVYNPSLREDKHFDLEVEYHFFRKEGAAEAYFNRTEPQRFNPGTLGAGFDPSTGQPLMAGQGIPLSAFREGEYRLAIRVKDLVSGRSIERQVRFTVRS